MTAGPLRVSQALPRARPWFFRNEESPLPRSPVSAGRYSFADSPAMPSSLERVDRALRFAALFDAPRLEPRAGLEPEAPACPAAAFAFLAAAQRFRAAATILARPSGLSLGFGAEGSIADSEEAGARPPILCRKAAMRSSISCNC